MKQNWKSHLGTVVVAVAALSAVHFWQTRHAQRGLAPDFTLALLSGVTSQVFDSDHLAARGQMSMAQWRQAHPGRAVAIYIWADWCPICKLVEPSVSRVSGDFPVLTVASRSAQAPQLARWMAQRGLNWPTVLDPSGAVSRLYGLGAVPVWIVLTPDGYISSISVGYTTEPGMRLRLWWAQKG